MRNVVIIAALLLSGCAYTTGSVQGVAKYDAASGYDAGVGVSVDAATKDDLSLVTRVTVASMAKDAADSGYVYSGAVGVRYGVRYFIEGGRVWYGYESNLADGSVWADNEVTWYGAVGFTRPAWQGVLRYYPSPGDKYDVETVRFESRVYLGRWLVSLEPGIYKITVNGQRSTELDARAGVGWAW